MVRKLAKEKYSGTLRLSIKNFMGCGKKILCGDIRTKEC